MRFAVVFPPFMPNGTAAFFLRRARFHLLTINNGRMDHPSEVSTLYWEPGAALSWRRVRDGLGRSIRAILLGNYFYQMGNIHDQAIRRPALHRARALSGHLDRHEGLRR